jgi:hypothetical protein
LLPLVVSSMGFFFSIIYALLYNYSLILMLIYIYMKHHSLYLFLPCFIGSVDYICCLCLLWF